MENLQQIIKENPNSLNKNTNVISIGLDMQCNEVMAKSTLYQNKDKVWCIINGGLRMICNNLSNLYIDTKENRKELMNKIRTS